MEAAQEGSQRLEAQIEAALPASSLARAVGPLQALRGVAQAAAAIVAAELGDVTRFDDPRQLMAYIRLRSEPRATDRILWDGRFHHLQTSLGHTLGIGVSGRLSA